MIGHRVDPFIERRIKFCNYMLLPLLPYEAQHDSRLIYRVLEKIRHELFEFSKTNMNSQ